MNQPVVITNQPVSTQTVCEGNSVTIAVAATGDGLTYQWYKGATILADGGAVSGATTDTLTINPLNSSDAGNNFHCIVTGISPCNPVPSTNSTLIVNQTPAITSNPASTQTICTGNSVSFSVSANGGSLSYQWFKGAQSLSNGGNISGANSATLTINPVTSADSASDYYSIVSNGCVGDATSTNAELIVSPKPVIPAQAINTCSGLVFSFSPIDGVPNASTIVPANTLYSWTAPSVTGGITGGAAQNNQASISGTLFNPTNTNQTATYTVTPVSGTLVSCPGATFILTVTVKPSPSVTNITTAICSGDTINISPANGSGNIVPLGTQYSWGVPIVTGGLTGGTSGTTLTSIAQTLTNPMNLAQTATYNITGLSETCMGNTFTLVITVNPKPVASVNTASQTICSGVANLPIVVSNSVNSATTYSWTRDNTVNVTGPSSATSGLIAAGNNYSISNILTNTTSISQTVVYTITPTTNGCIGTPITSTIQVSPASVGGAATVSMPTVTPVVTSTTVCHLGSGTLYLSGHLGNVVRWESSTTGGTTWLPN